MIIYIDCSFLLLSLSLSSFCFLSSSYLPLDSLCIHPGMAAWCLYLDVVVLSYDAGVLDSAVLGAVAALRDGKSMSLILISAPFPARADQ